jgi:hypothetical protein
MGLHGHDDHARFAIVSRQLQLGNDSFPGNEFAAESGVDIAYKIAVLGKFG